MVSRDGKTGDGGPGGIGPEELKAILGALGIGNLASELGEVVAARIREAMAGGMALRVNGEDYTDTESLKRLAEAMSGRGSGVQSPDVRLGKEKDIGGDTGKNKATIDLLGNLT